MVLRMFHLMVLFDGFIYLLGWDRRTFLDVTVPVCFLLKLLQPILGASVITVSMCYCHSDHKRTKIWFVILLCNFNQCYDWFQIAYKILNQSECFVVGIGLGISIGVLDAGAWAYMSRSV